MIQEHDLVILKHRKENIFSNSIGTVIHIHTDDPFKKVYVVEFVGEETSTILNLFEYEIQKFKRNGI